LRGRKPRRAVHHFGTGVSELKDKQAGSDFPICHPGNAGAVFRDKGGSRPTGTASRALVPALPCTVAGVTKTGGAEVGSRATKGELARFRPALSGLPGKDAELVSAAAREKHTCELRLLSYGRAKSGRAP